MPLSAPVVTAKPVDEDVFPGRVMSKARVNDMFKVGCEVGVNLPVVQTEFEQDFQPSDAVEQNSIDRFRRLLGQARTVHELDGSMEAASRSLSY